MCLVLTRVLTDNRNKYVPIAKHNKRNSPKWMSKKIKKSIKKRNRALKNTRIVLNMEENTSNLN